MSKLHLLWTELTKQIPDKSTTGFLLQLLDAHVGCKIFAAVEVTRKKRCIVIAVPRGSIISHDTLPDSSAFRCIVADINGLGDSNTGIVLILEDDTYEDLFVLLSEDVINAASHSESSVKAVSAVIKTIDRWRRFVMRCGNGLLNDNEIRGLIGEMAILSRLIGKYGEYTGVKSWCGPEKAIHDFSMPGFEVEVKTHQGKPGGAIWINDLSQLQPGSSLPLFLTVVTVTRMPDSGMNLPAFINLLKSLVINDPTASELLMIKLAESGYVDGLEQKYREKKYIIGKTDFYRVDREFPSILPDAVPAAVEKVRYCLRLAPLETWRTDSDALLGPVPQSWRKT